ncbi:hypothetical protein FB451DRAFT_1280938 [Mycena latifolia]|nr:hypothetical protein FB451DRAFT_1280938 [Mycena latifolia]
MRVLPAICASSFLSFAAVAVPLTSSSGSDAIVKTSREDHDTYVVAARQGADLFGEINPEPARAPASEPGPEGGPNEAPPIRFPGGGGCVIA